MSFCLRFSTLVTGVLLLLFLFLAHAMADESHFSYQEVLCRKENKSTIFELNYDAPLACRLRYKKINQPSPQPRILWHAHRDKGFCEKKLKNHVNVFERYGWICSPEDTKVVVVPPPSSAASSREIASKTVDTPEAKPAPEANRQVTRTLVAFHLSQNDSKTAEDELATRIKQHPLDAEYWKLLGTVRNRNKDFKGARVAFLKAAELSQGTEQGENLYLVALAEMNSGDRVAAESTLEVLQEKSEFREAVDGAFQALKTGKPLPVLDRQKVEAVAREEESQNGWRLLGTVTSGYDSNVVLLPDSGTGISPGSSFITPSVQGAYLTNLFKSPLQLYLQAGYTYNAEELAKTYNNMPLMVGAEWHLPGRLGSVHRISVSNEAGFVFVHPSNLYLFSSSDTLLFKKALQYGKGNSVHFLLPVGYSWYPGVNVAPINNREGFNSGGGVMNQHTWGKVIFTEYFGYNHQFALGNNFKSDSYSVTGSSGTNLFSNIFGLAFGGYTYTNYPRSESLREDSKYSLGVLFSRRLDFWGPLVASLGYSHEWNVSTVDSAKYNKGIASLKITYALE
ncbi:MAG: tetratricopeptide repeat protein [Pseudomonadota bacterium]